MSEVITVIAKLSGLTFVLTSMLAMGLSLTIKQIDPRGIHYFYGIYWPKKLSKQPATQYLMAMADKDGNILEAGKAYKLTLPKDVPEGKLTIRFEFETTGKPDRSKGEGAPGTGKLFFNDTLAGSGKIDRTVGNFYGEEGASCGYDFGETVSKEYESPFPFTGKINSLKVDMLGEDVRGWDAHAAKALAQD